VQVGVQLLLFGLGMEFSVEKLRHVGSVAILGGSIEIVLFIFIFAVGSVLIGGGLSDGIFVGALVSMSSTSVVIKTLGDKCTSNVSQIVIGTLILQDCSVGLMFALMPVLSSLADPQSGLDPEATGEIVVLILKVLLWVSLQTLLHDLGTLV
jgi:Kef-type K+ transport system membrane component KefB